MTATTSPDTTPYNHPFVPQTKVSKLSGTENMPIDASNANICTFKQS
jgi:hypothetical protein